MAARKNLTIEIESPVGSPLPTTSTTKKRLTFPDVPRDVDTLADEHWNDPNYDLNGLPSPTASTADSFELDRKGQRGSTTCYSTSEYDGESHSGSSKDHSASKLKFDDDEVECVFPPVSGCRALLITKFRESPYLEVRAAVSNVDDPSMPVSTVRM